MVQDLRNIVLSLDEVKSAFKCYQRVAPDYFPTEAIADCKVTEEAVVVKLESIADSTLPPREHIFRGVEILKPLIRFCIENNIMLPRDGKKSVLLQDGKVILHIQLDLTTDMPAAIKPLQERQTNTERAKNFIAVATAGI